MVTQPGQPTYWVRGRDGEMVPMYTPPPTNGTAIPQAPGFYAPDVGSSFDRAQRALTRYDEASQAPAQHITGLGQGLEDLGGYNAFDFKAPEVATPDYNEFQYRMPSTALPEYQKTTFDYAQNYNSPTPYEGFNYTTPQISDLSEVAPEVNAVWEGRRSAERERISKQFDDARSRVSDAITSGQTRPEQAAALLAGIQQQEAEAQRAAARDIDSAQSQQVLGIKQQEQSLGLQKGISQAGMDATTQENQAKEMAQKYNMSLDEARYQVQLQAEQQSNQASENQGAQKLGMDRALALDTQEANLQSAQAGESRYKYEQDVGKATTEAAYQQWVQEQKAAEAEKAYLSEYGRRQDMDQAKLSEFETNRSADYDRMNALLQGEQAATGQASQQATYYTNLSDGQKNQASDYVTQKARYDAANPPAQSRTTTTARPASMTASRPASASSSTYRMPSSSASTGGYRMPTIRPAAQGGTYA